MSSRLRGGGTSARRQQIFDSKSDVLQRGLARHEFATAAVRALRFFTAFAGLPIVGVPLILLERTRFADAHWGIARSPVVLVVEG